MYSVHVKSLIERFTDNADLKKLVNDIREVEEKHVMMRRIIMEFYKDFTGGIHQYGSRLFAFCVKIAYMI